MGIINVTPDSFYPGARCETPERAVELARRLVDEGADILDIGGESTRPGSAGVGEAEELRRTIGVIERVSALGARVSVDTSKSAVAGRALAAGATILNDVTALRGDPAMPAVAARFENTILMHMQGAPRTMQQDPRYGDVVREVAAFLRERMDAFAAAGGDAGRVWLDPGLGFGKTFEHNLELLRRLEELRVLGRPMVLGASRKAFIGRLAAGGAPEPAPQDDRLEGSLAVACRAAEAGVAVVRVHDVKETRRALEAFVAGRPPATRPPRGSGAIAPLRAGKELPPAGGEKHG